MYSGQIFGGGDGLTAAEASLYINICFTISAGIGSVLLLYYGRKSIYIWTQILCTIGLFGMWIFTSIYDDETMTIILTFVFLLGFNAGTGPILWIYIAESCNDTACSLNTVVNWVLSLVVSIYTPPMLDYFKGYSWLICGVLSIIQLVYIGFYMKETKGLSKD